MTEMGAELSGGSKWSLAVGRLMASKKRKQTDRGVRAFLNSLWAEGRKLLA